MLHNHFGMLLWWGPQFVQIYNDAYRPVLGDKHPRAMGQPICECWAEVFAHHGPDGRAAVPRRPGLDQRRPGPADQPQVVREETHFASPTARFPTRPSSRPASAACWRRSRRSPSRSTASANCARCASWAPRAAEARTAEQAVRRGRDPAGKTRGRPVRAALPAGRDGRRARGRQRRVRGGDTWLDAAPARSTSSADCPWPLAVAAHQQRHRDHRRSRRARRSPCRQPLVRPPALGHRAAAVVSRPGQRYGVLVCGVSPHRVLDDRLPHVLRAGGRRRS